jgi:hypothetical protein
MTKLCPCLGVVAGFLAWMKIMTKLCPCVCVVAGDTYPTGKRLQK